MFEDNLLGIRCKFLENDVFVLNKVIFRQHERICDDENSFLPYNKYVKVYVLILC